MAGSKLNTYSSSYTSLTNYATCIDGQREGYTAAHLNNSTTTTIPSIASGGKIEVAGSLYAFSSDEPISTASVTSTADTTWFIELVPSSSQITAQFSTTTPAFRRDYNGWYLSTSSNHRYLDEYIYKSSSSIYSQNRYKIGRTFITSYNSTATVMSTGSAVTVASWNATLYDIHSELNSSQFVPQRSGLYHLSFRAGCAGGITTNTFYAILGTASDGINGDVALSTNYTVFSLVERTMLLQAGTPVYARIYNAVANSSFYFTLTVTQID